MHICTLTPSLLAVPLLPLLSLACVAEPDDDELLEARAGEYPPLPEEGTAMAYGMLRVANELDFETLDIDVGLNSQAAESIIAYRAGADEILGTADDQFIPGIAELDALYWLGPSNLWRIQNYAALHGFDPDPLPATSCEPELEDAISSCLRYLEDNAEPGPQYQGQFGVAPFKADLLPSCLEANDVDYPSADFFAGAGTVGFLDPLLGYQSLLCELNSEPVCALGVAGVADRSQPECADFFAPALTLSETAVDPADRADWDNSIANLEGACLGSCDYWVRVYDYAPGMVPTLLGDVMDEVLSTAPYEIGGAYLSREISNQIPYMAPGAASLLADVLDDLGLAGESYDVGVAANEVPCPNCHLFRDSFVLLLRDAGVVVVLDRESYWDS